MTESEQQISRSEWVCDALDRYEGPLTRYAARIVGDVDRARDVVQDTFLRLCSQDQAELDGRLPEWLFTVCRNRALDVRRKDRRMKGLTEAHTDDRVSDDPSPDAVAEGQDTTSRVLHLLGGLPDNQQEVVRLKFQNGLSYRQISEITELTVSNVGYLIHTAIKTLRTKLHSEPGFFTKA